jgi:hypothetical protein
VKKLIATFLIGGLLGTAGGFAAGIFVFPYLFLDDVATEEVSGLETKTVVAQGEFIHAKPSDPVHWGRGGLKVYQDLDGGRVIHLERSFEVGPGPRFHVYVSDRADVLSNADFEASNTIDLGRLKAFKGSQNYNLPLDLELSAYKSVVIWCKEFGVLISPATLTAPA